ncbi:hypothetical protein HKD37_03G007731 [Glycine soja]
MNTSSSNVFDAGPSNLHVPRIVHQFEASFHVQQNVIEVPLSYHRQWSPNYPNYVLFDYEGDKHFIKLHKYGNRFYFGDGLKELRRTHGIHESVLMRFVGRDKKYYVQCGRCGTSTPKGSPNHKAPYMIHQNYQLVLPPEASIYLTASKKYMVVDCGSGRHQKWMITMNNGMSCVADAWIHCLGDCHLKAGDEVIFFYNIDQHLWEVLYRKQVTWDDTEDEADSP